MIISNGGTLSALGRDLTISGDFTINGDYTSSSERSLNLTGILNSEVDGTGRIGTVAQKVNVYFRNGSKDILSGSAFSIVNGKLVMDANLTVENYGSISVSGNIEGVNATTSIWVNEASSQVQVGGTFFVAGTPGSIDASTDGNTVEYNSGAAQTIIATTYHNLIISNAAGVKTLRGNTTIDGDLTLNTNLLTSSSYTLSFNTGASNPTESNSAMIIGSSVMDSRTVGTGTLSFLGVDISSGADDIGSVSLTRVNGNSVAATGPDGVTTVGSNTSIQCYWDVSVGTEPSGRDISFSWLSGLDNGLVFSASDLANLWRKPSATWIGMGTTDVSVPAMNPMRVASTNTDNFTNRWTISKHTSPLPIELLDFSASCKNKIITLNWSTASETNNDYFNLERSVDAHEWLNVAKINGMGNSNTLKNYSYTDSTKQHPIAFGTTNNEQQTMYYRLKQTDFDGVYTYSDVIYAGCFNPSIEYIQVFPNPAYDYLSFNISSIEVNTINVTIINVMGQSVFSDKFDVIKGANTFTIDVSKLSPTTYYFKVETLDGLYKANKLILIR